jgi:hypothetical protein
MKVQTQINDLGALHDAANELGLGFQEHAGVRGYYGLGDQCDVVLKLKGPYDVGFTKQADGTYQMTCDWWSGHVEKEIGSKGGKLLQSYAYHKIAREAGQRGYSVQKSMEKDGKMRVRIIGF